MDNGLAESTPVLFEMRTLAQFTQAISMGRQIPTIVYFVSVNDYNVGLCVCIETALQSFRVRNVFCQRN